MDSFDKAVQNMTTFSWGSLNLSDDEIEKEIGNIGEPNSAPPQGKLTPYVPGANKTFPTAQQGSKAPQGNIAHTKTNVSVQNVDGSQPQTNPQGTNRVQQKNNASQPTKVPTPSPAVGQTSGMAQSAPTPTPPQSQPKPQNNAPEVHHAEEGDGPTFNLGGNATVSSKEANTKPITNSVENEEKKAEKSQPQVEARKEKDTKSDEQNTDNIETPPITESANPKVKSQTEEYSDDEDDEDEPEIISEPVDEWERKNSPDYNRFVKRMLRNIGVFVGMILLMIGAVLVYHKATGKRNLEKQNSTEQPMEIADVKDNTTQGDSTESFFDWYGDEYTLGQDFLQTEQKKKEDNITTETTTVSTTENVESSNKDGSQPTDKRFNSIDELSVYIQSSTGVVFDKEKSLTLSYVNGQTQKEDYLTAMQTYCSAMDELLHLLSVNKDNYIAAGKEESYNTLLDGIEEALTFGDAAYSLAETDTPFLEMAKQLGLE